MKVVVVLVSVLTVCYCHPYFRAWFPNGYNVPNPCAGDIGKIWSGAGHTNSSGGGALNPFGSDFSDNDYSWNEDFCLEDSDGDGKTNGEELGDFKCQWDFLNAKNIELGMATGHPGICEPMTKPDCVTKNQKAQILCP